MKKILLLFTTLSILFYSHGIASAQIAMTAENNFDPQSLSPGEVYETYITYTNPSLATYQVVLDTVDGVITPQGYPSARLSEEEQFFLGNWSTFEEDSFPLTGGESKKVKFIITIPGNATPGDYAGAVTVATEDAESIEAPTTIEEGTLGISLKPTTRKAKIFYVSIPGDKKIDIQFGELSFTEEVHRDNRGTLSIQNNGNTALQLSINTTLESRFGENRDFDTVEKTLLPGDKIDLPIIVGDLPIFGIFNLNVNIEYGELNLITKEVTPIDTLNKNAELTIIPWNYIIIFLVLLILTITVVTFKKKNYKKLLDSCKEYKIQKGDTLGDLAEKRNTNWKTIIKINKLKAPYELKQGQKILLPEKK